MPGDLPLSYGPPVLSLGNLIPNRCTAAEGCRVSPRVSTTDATDTLLCLWYSSRRQPVTPKGCRVSPRALPLSYGPPVMSVVNRSSPPTGYDPSRVRVSPRALPLSYGPPVMSVVNLLPSNRLHPSRVPGEPRALPLSYGPPIIFNFTPTSTLRAGDGIRTRDVSLEG